MLSRRRERNKREAAEGAVEAAVVAAAFAKAK